MVIGTSWRTWAYDFITISILNWPSSWWIVMKLWSKKIKGQCFKIEYHPMQCWRHIKKIKNHLKTLTLVMICLSNCILNCNIKNPVNKFKSSQTFVRTASAYKYMLERGIPSFLTPIDDNQWVATTFVWLSIGHRLAMPIN